MDIIIRIEEEKDFRKAENMTREAFWDVYKPGCDEHLLLNKIRKSDALVKELNYVAVDGEEVVGNVIYTRAKVVNDDNESFEVLCMGPLGVLPSYQGKGIAKELMNRTISEAKELGYKGIIIFGNPDYYKKYGFKNAKEYNITTSWGENIDPFMALELGEGALEGISGKFYEDAVFQISEEELEEFENGFPYKEKHILDTQL